MPKLYQLCLFLFVSLIQSIAVAEIYTWTDESGQVHYSQQPPNGQQVQQIDVPAPPAIAPVETSDEVQELINLQIQQEQYEAYKAEYKKDKKHYQQQKQQNCEIAKSNLAKYQISANRKIRDADGNITRLTEDERQQHIARIKKQITKFCD
jgi:hypothetical protein